MEVGKLRERLHQHEVAFDKDLQVSVCACSLTCNRLLFVIDHNCAATLCP
jgi:hypothetical protein